MRAFVGVIVSAIVVIGLFIVTTAVMTVIGFGVGATIGLLVSKAFGISAQAIAHVYAWAFAGITLLSNVVMFSGELRNTSKGSAFIGDFEDD